MEDVLGASSAKEASFSAPALAADLPFPLPRRRDNYSITFPSSSSSSESGAESLMRQGQPKQAGGSVRSFVPGS